MHHLDALLYCKILGWLHFLVAKFFRFFWSSPSWQTAIWASSMTKPIKWPVRQADSDQPGYLPSVISYRCLHEETLPLSTECTGKTDQFGHMHRLIWQLKNKNRKLLSITFIQHTCSQILLQSFGPLTETENMSHLMTQPTKWLCAQRRLRSAWASDQSLRCALNG